MLLCYLCCFLENVVLQTNGNDNIQDALGTEHPLGGLALLLPPSDTFLVILLLAKSPGELQSQVQNL